MLRFRRDAELRWRIDELMEAESRCCALLDFQVEAERGATLVTVAAPHGAEPTLREFAGLFTASG